MVSSSALIAYQQIENAGFGMRSDRVSKPLPNLSASQWLGRLGRVRGPLSFRLALSVQSASRSDQFSQSDIAEGISEWVARESNGRRQRHYTKATISTWERQETGKMLPRGYWSKRWMPRYVELAFHAMIVALAAQVLKGMYRVRVTGCIAKGRPWRVTLRRVA